MGWVAEVYPIPPPFRGLSNVVAKVPRKRQPQMRTSEHQQATLAILNLDFLGSMGNPSRNPCGFFGTRVTS